MEDEEDEPSIDIDVTGDKPDISVDDDDEEEMGEDDVIEINGRKYAPVVSEMEDEDDEGMHDEDEEENLDLEAVIRELEAEMEDEDDDVKEMEDEMEDEEQPHFVIIDEINGYWFVTATQSGYVGMFDLETDTLISSIEVGNMPALLALDDMTKTLYVSRMMSGMDMGDGMDMMMPSYKLNSLDYSGGSLVSLEDVCLAPTEDFLEFPDPHAISFSNTTSRDGGTLLSASFTSDWMSRTDIWDNGNRQTVHRPFTVGQSSPDFPENKLFPLAVTQKDNYAFYSCSGNSDADVNVAGQVQSWTVGEISDPSLKSIYEFTPSSMLWHIVESPIDKQIFVVSSGGSEVGVTCLSYDNAEDYTDENGNGSWDEGEEFIDTGNELYDSDGVLDFVWHTTDLDFTMLHGITVSADGAYLYLSSRGNGSIYILDAMSGELLNSTTVSGSIYLSGIDVIHSE